MVEITYTLCHCDGTPDGKITVEQVKELLPSLEAADVRARAVLALPTIFSSVDYWDKEGFHIGQME